MAHHHGTMNRMLHGIDAMKQKKSPKSGRFGRLFPELPGLELAESTLQKLGALNGPMDGGQGKDATHTIPLGMVFLGQFIDHDITLDVTSRLDRINDPMATINFRTPTLDLDSIYGSGPDASNFLYAQGKPYLLTAADGTAWVEQTPEHRAHDLARSSAGVAIIGDPRNDENRIISQLQLAFIRFHNEVVRTLEIQGVSDKILFEEASQLVRWHYQWIVVNEFLPLMIGRAKVDQFLNKRNFYTPTHAFIPIEFAAAAYRFGHSMAPQRLKIKSSQANAFELFGPSLGRGFSPIDDIKQVVEWDVLFDINLASPAQRANKLDVLLAEDLLKLPFLPPSNNSLATRNLLRGQSFLLPSGEQIAASIGQSQEEINRVREYVAQSISNHNLDLSEGTPLWYYILAEASVAGHVPNESLGHLGATIIGETLIGLLALDETSYFHQPNWRPTLGNANHFTMADLLTYQASPVSYANS